MRNRPARWTAIAAVAAVSLMAAPAAAEVPPPPDLPPSERTLFGDGEFQGRPVGGRLVGAFECVAAATPAALVTGIQRCELLVDGAVVARAETLGVPGPVATTGSAVAIPLYTPPTSIVVCWQVFAGYADGLLLMGSGCKPQPVQ